MGADSTSTAAQERRARGGGFFSTTFGQPEGTRVADGGYYIDLRVKAPSPDWPPAQLETAELWVITAQWGLGAYEHFVHTGDEAWLEAARAAGERLVSEQDEDGAWMHTRPYPHTYRLEPPWPSAMAQGEAASLLVRLHSATGDERFAGAARRGVGAMPAAELEGAPFYEEYPTEPASHVLNGGIFALWGLRDVAEYLSDSTSRAAFDAGLDCLVANIGRWDTGWWSAYDLYPHRLRNVSSSAYHELHIAQVRAMHAVEPRPELADTAARFERYGASRARRLRALAAKVAFRMAVPRR